MNGGNSSAGGTSGTLPVPAAGTTGKGGAPGSTTAGAAVSAMPALTEGMITQWTKAPYLFGPWFTYGWGSKADAACTPEPVQGITATEEGMCISWSGCGVTGQGAALGFKVCAAPKYPNESGESTWFPLACTGTNADSCVESEQAKPYAFCGGAIKAVSFAPVGQAVSVAFLDDVGANGTVLETVSVGASGTTAAFTGDGGRIAAVHFKIANPDESGRFCVKDVAILR